MLTGTCCSGRFGSGAIWGSVWTHTTSYWGGGLSCGWLSWFLSVHSGYCPKQHLKCELWAEDIMDDCGVSPTTRWGRGRAVFLGLMEDVSHKNPPETTVFKQWTNEPSLHSVLVCFCHSVFWRVLLVNFTECFFLTRADTGSGIARKAYGGICFTDEYREKTKNRRRARSRRTGRKALPLIMGFTSIDSEEEGAASSPALMLCEPVSSCLTDAVKDASSSSVGSSFTTTGSWGGAECRSPSFALWERAGCLLPSWTHWLTQLSCTASSVGDVLDFFWKKWLRTELLHFWPLCLGVLHLTAEPGVDGDIGGVSNVALDSCCLKKESKKMHIACLFIQRILYYCNFLDYILQICRELKPFRKEKWVTISTVAREVNTLTLAAPAPIIAPFLLSKKKGDALALWLCVKCGKQNKLQPGHYLAIKRSQWGVWCSAFRI